MQDKKIHQGRNIKRFREMLGIKQDALAFDLGEDWNQKKISILEQKEMIADPLLKKISEVLKIPVEAFQNFDEEEAVNVIANTFGDHGIGYQKNDNPIFNPIEQVLKLHEEKITLYERMLKEKDDMVAKLEQYLQKP
ncbi:helix-turn-helix transcriptional regulator [Chryseobacterium sp. JJR-5R]|uniref:helix-turn-helix transcriptional regulator n=1 Tax=Chryseobacterium sp. JJR-5R TaxID=3093923 RepID=UPI002A747FEF|nr:helix-turn-helix transcriptional regulator [Chryseobacterium sp. JJR-5R]WPO82249.1 helix-turn-helix transcriptional regulator [Chryseobacterium sp. JJR-5R]